MIRRAWRIVLGLALTVAVLAAATCGDVGVSCSRSPAGAVT